MNFVRVLLLVVMFCMSLVTARAQSLQDRIVSQERAELECLKKADVQCFADLIADDAVFLDPHGAATKQEVLSNITGLKLIEFSMDDIHFVALGDASGVVAYKLTEKGTAHGHEFTNVVFASAAWANRGGKWVSVFSQETPAHRSPGM